MIDAFCEVCAPQRPYCNVLQHPAGYFSELLAPDDRVEPSAVVDRDRRERLPFIVPVTLIQSTMYGNSTSNT
jgi:uncharacterized protein YbgA (DUF1722 family)